MRLVPLPFVSHLKILHTVSSLYFEKSDGIYFPEKHPKIPKWGKNLVKNACLLYSLSLLNIFLNSCLITGQNK